MCSVQASLSALREVAVSGGKPHLRHRHADTVAKMLTEVSLQLRSLLPVPKWPRQLTVLCLLCLQLAPVLIGRFSERQHHVKVRPLATV